jgi:RimJ/RimL family protein N-acetyltransferase
MLTLHQATIGHLSALLELPQRTEIDGLRLPTGEEIAPTIDRVYQRSIKARPRKQFWWSMRSIVGAIGFKSPPDSNCSVEIGYGIIPSQQERGFAVELLVKEGF